MFNHIRTLFYECFKTFLTFCFSYYIFIKGKKWVEASLKPEALMKKEQFSAIPLKRFKFVFLPRRDFFKHNLRWTLAKRFIKDGKVLTKCCKNFFFAALTRKKARFVHLVSFCNFQEWSILPTYVSFFVSFIVHFIKMETIFAFYLVLSTYSLFIFIHKYLHSFVYILHRRRPTTSISMEFLWPVIYVKMFEQVLEKRAVKASVLFVSKVFWGL